MSVLFSPLFVLIFSLLPRLNSFAFLPFFSSLKTLAIYVKSRVGGSQKPFSSKKGGASRRRAATSVPPATTSSSSSSSWVRTPPAVNHAALFLPFLFWCLPFFFPSFFRRDSSPCIFFKIIPAAKKGRKTGRGKGGDRVKCIKRRGRTGRRTRGFPRMSLSKKIP